MSEPVFFVIERGTGGGEFPSIIRDLLPYALTRKGSTSLVYAMRLDKLPDGEQLAARPLQALYEMYLRTKAEGTLIQNLADAPMKAAPSRRALYGEWWTPPVRTWDHTAPPNPDYADLVK